MCYLLLTYTDIFLFVIWYHYVICFWWKFCPVHQMQWEHSSKSCVVLTTFFISTTGQKHESLDVTPADPGWTRLLTWSCISLQLISQSDIRNIQMLTAFAPGKASLGSPQPAWNAQNSTVWGKSEHSKEKNQLYLNKLGTNPVSATCWEIRQSVRGLTHTAPPPTSLLGSHGWASWWNAFHCVISPCLSRSL